ncbi:MAG: glycosyltransferase family 2 protein [Gemmatimonadetes bacterium]|nr:glycosyltransferase family 2 protein [Gemmatimonadota bacterium]MYG15805.1 glycosyltransferase family 2 protein [Gemmatimonadota bacterium]
MSLSVIIIARNEAPRIEACLRSARFADEIVLVDSGSTDDTVAIARQYAARVVESEWLGYGPTKQLALEHATGDWVLWLDADERVPQDLRDEITAVMDKGDRAGYRIARKTLFLGRWIRHCGWYPDYVLRLFRRGADPRFTDDEVHEALRIRGPVGDLKHPMIHDTDPTLHHYLDKFNSFTSLGARQLYRSGRRFRLTDLVFRPIFTLFKMYVLRRGFLDGLPGLILCGLSACYVFTKYAKLWHLHLRGSADAESGAGGRST